MDELLNTVERCAAGSADRLELWDGILGALRPETVLEIGVWQGDFAAHTLARCPWIRSYWMIDPWRQLPNWNKPLNVDNATFDAAYREAMAAIAFARDRVIVSRGTTI